MYARNISAFLQLLVKDGKLQLNLEDDIIKSTLVTQGGEVVNPRVREFFALPPLVVALTRRQPDDENGSVHQRLCISCSRLSSAWR
jgi:hypothetical protein